MAKKETKEKTLSPRDVAKKTLESKFYQQVVGSNKVRTNPFLYGQLGLNGGEQSYDAAMSSEEATKMRNDLYQKMKQEYANFGVYGEPAYPTNGDISLNIMREFERSKAMFSLKDLESYVKSVAPGFEFSVPDELKDYVPAEIAVKEKPDEKEKDAMAVYQQILSQAYDRGLALNAAKSGYFADLNAAGKIVSEKYKKPEKEKK